MRSDCMIETEATELTEFADSGERRTAKLGSGWSSYELWKTTIREPRGQGLVKKPLSLAQQLDEQEERLLIRQQKRFARRVWIAVLLILVSSVVLFADRHHAEPRVTRSSKQLVQPQATQSQAVPMPVET